MASITNRAANAFWIGFALEAVHLLGRLLGFIGDAQTIQQLWQDKGPILSWIGWLISTAWFGPLIMVGSLTAWLILRRAERHHAADTASDRTIKIRVWRDMVQTIHRQTMMLKNKNRSVTSLLEVNTDFLSFRPHLSDRSRKAVFHNTFIVPPQQSTMSGTLHAILADIERVEREWGLGPPTPNGIPTALRGFWARFRLMSWESLFMVSAAAVTLLTFTILHFADAAEAPTSPTQPVTIAQSTGASAFDILGFTAGNEGKPKWIRADGSGLLGQFRTTPTLTEIPERKHTQQQNGISVSYYDLYSTYAFLTIEHAPRGAMARCQILRGPEESFALPWISQPDSSLPTIQALDKASILLASFEDFPLGLGLERFTRAFTMFGVGIDHKPAPRWTYGVRDRREASASSNIGIERPDLDITIKFAISDAEGRDLFVADYVISPAFLMMLKIAPK